MPHAGRRGGTLPNEFRAGDVSVFNPHAYPTRSSAVEVHNGWNDEEAVYLLVLPASRGGWTALFCEQTFRHMESCDSLEAAHTKVRAWLYDEHPRHVCTSQCMRLMAGAWLPLKAPQVSSKGTGKINSIEDILQIWLEVAAEPQQRAWWLDPGIGLLFGAIVVAIILLLVAQKLH